MSYFEPALPFLLLLSLYSLVRAWRRSSRGKRPWPQAIGTAGTILLSLNAAAWLFSRPLEMWYDENPEPQGTAEAIVVLAGFVNPPAPDTPYAVAGQDTYVRLKRAAWLFKHWKPLPILICAGGRDPEWYARTMQHALTSEGVPPEVIWVESRSRNTRENALYGTEILRMHRVSRIALVVEASSMPRAAASFEKLGISVVPAPARFTQLSGLEDFIPNWRAIASNGETLHELIGLLWYRVRGWI